MVLETGTTYIFCRWEGLRLFFETSHKALASMKRISEVRKTIKNCTKEVPEGNSVTFASALCNAGFKSRSKAIMSALIILIR